MPYWQYLLWTLPLVLGSVLAWLSNVFGLPGNWLVVAAAAAFAYFIPETHQHGLAWGGVILLLVLAAVGEAIEFFAGAAGAAKHGASKRAVFLACVGAMVGGIVGAILGLPIPLVGSMVAALFGSAAGSFAGAYLGQKWSRRTETESLAAGQGAFVGRLLGTAGKLLIGAVMLVALVVDLYFA